MIKLLYDTWFIWALWILSLGRKGGMYNDHVYNVCFECALIKAVDTCIAVLVGSFQYIYYSTKMFSHDQLFITCLVLYYFLNKAFRLLFIFVCISMGMPIFKMTRYAFPRNLIQLISAVEWQKNPLGKSVSKSLESCYTQFLIGKKPYFKLNLISAEFYHFD